MNIRKRAKLAVPCTVTPGDVMQVTYRDYGPDGKWRETVLIEDRFTHSQTFDEAAIIDGEIEGRGYVGGILIERAILDAEPKP
jgi:hypothetical protein